MMSQLGRSFAAFCAFTVLLAGCKPSQSTTAPGTGGGGFGSQPIGSQPSGAQPSGKPGPTTNVTASPLPNQFTTANITDPSLKNIVAATLTIPAGWQLQGIMTISPCTFLPWPVFRASSPDALMQMSSEPVIGWQWHPNVKGTFNTGCANISGQISAAAFLQYYLGTMQGSVRVEGPMTVTQVYSQWAQGLAAQKNQLAAGAPAQMQSQNTADTAALRIEVGNGSSVAEERLRTVVECSVSTNPSSPAGTCWARVDVLTAPLGELDALVQLVDNNNLPHGVTTQQWTQAALQRQQQQGTAEMKALTAQEQKEAKELKEPSTKPSSSGKSPSSSSKSRSSKAP
jgi:hypothetical protein